MDLPPGKVWQNWQGNHKFFCDGRIISGPELSPAAMIAVATAAPGITFAAFTTPRLDELAGASIMTPIFSFFLAWTLLELALTVFTDPGIIPRDLECDARIEMRPPRTQIIVSAGKRVDLTFCDQCGIFRPPKAEHCGDCNACVLQFDHHCPWVGNCIGQRNYRHFLRFLLLATLIILCAIAGCLAHIIIESTKRQPSGARVGFGSALKHVHLSFVVLILSFVLGWFVGAMASYHVYISCLSETTYEQMVDHYARRPNPVRRGCVSLFRRLCATVPSQLSLRAPHEAATPSPAPEVAMSPDNDTFAV